MKVCPTVGCFETTENKYCLDCTKARWIKRAEKRADAGKSSPRARLYDSQWDRYSKAYRQKHPICANVDKDRCLSVLEGTPELSGTAVVDHIIPHKGDQKRFRDPKNHQPLCARCHDNKTAKGL